VSINSNAQTNKINPADTLKKGKNYNIDRVDISKNKKQKDDKVFIRFGFPTPIPTSNAITSNVITSKRYNEDGSVPVFDKIDILKGKYEDIVVSKDTKVRNLFTISRIEFPLHLKLTSGAEIIEFELNEAGQWDIWIELKNN
jgi:hypothetical protein